MDLKFYTSVTKRVETKSKEVLGAYPNVCRRSSGKTGWATFLVSPVLNRVKE